MSRFELTDSFFEDEVREGFYIPSAVKKAWGAELKVLNELDRVCSRLGIRYFATWGTFLGAVRHGGYVPWDDDLDICMLRDDYLRFIEEGVPLLSEGYEVFTHKSKSDHTKFVANMVAKARICFEEEHLSQFHGFPYMAAIDLFQFDYMPKDEKEYERYRLQVMFVLKISDEIVQGKLEGDELKIRLKQLEEKLGIHVPEGLGLNEVRQFLDIKAEEMFAGYLNKKEKTEEVTQAMPVVVWDDHFWFLPSYYYSGQAELPFEMGKIPVPLYYLPAMRHHYRDYMKVRRGTAAHGYPFFAKMQEDLKSIEGFELPEYKVDIAGLTDRRKAVNSGSDDDPENYKTVVYECTDEMGRLQESLDASSDPEDVADICGQLQQLAIDLGTYMEAVKGEEYDIVSDLEKFCEVLYALSEEDTGERRSLVSRTFAELCEKIRCRREIVFLPFKVEYWEAFKDEYQKWAADPDADVYVIPIPYYYKDHLGRLYDMQYNPESYPHELPVLDYEESDLELRHPDIIYIQNPYDQWNEITSVPPYFYSDKLLSYTDRLIYIPWFVTYDFTRDDRPQYFNMKYYCNVPGVINADEVILRSETIKQVYIEKLCEFAGGETKDIWEKKLKVIEKTAGAAAKDPEIKTLLYYQDFSEVLYYGSRAVDKLKDELKRFIEEGEYERIVVLRSQLLDDMLPGLDYEIYNKYSRALEEAGLNELIEVMGESTADIAGLVAQCSGFYGDAGRIAHLFDAAGKPYEIQSYE